MVSKERVHKKCILLAEVSFGVALWFCFASTQSLPLQSDWGPYPKGIMGQPPSTKIRMCNFSSVVSAISWLLPGPIVMIPEPRLWHFSFTVSPISVPVCLHQM